MSRIPAKYMQLKPDLGPKLNDRNYKQKMLKALDFLHYETSVKDLKKETVKYYKKVNPEIGDTLEAKPDYCFGTLGKYAYMLSKGAEFDEATQASIQKLVDQVASYTKMVADNPDPDQETVEVEKSAVEKKVRDPNEATKSVAAGYCGEIEAFIDTFVVSPATFDPEKFDFKGWITSKGIKPGHAKFVEQFFKPLQDEIREMIDTQDWDLRKAYSANNRELRRLDKFLIKLFEEMSQLKVVRTTQRKKKPTDKNKLVSRLKFMQHCPVLGIDSIKPIKVVGAKELWVYNTKTKKIGLYTAHDAAGLTVKGTTVLNFSTSSIEKTVRKPDQFIKEFCKAATRKRKEMFRELKAIDVKLKGRTNEFMLLLDAIE